MCSILITTLSKLKGRTAVTYPNRLSTKWPIGCNSDNIDVKYSPKFTIYNDTENIIRIDFDGEYSLELSCNDCDESFTEDDDLENIDRLTVKIDNALSLSDSTEASINQKGVISFEHYNIKSGN